MTDIQPARETRQIVVEVETTAPPEQVWQTLTDPKEIAKWFSLEARVDPKVGGEVWLSWGPGVEGAAPIHILDPHSRFGWTENYGEDDAGRPVEVAVDFHIEGRDGTTVVRLVQSGLSADAQWDGMYDALTDGWTYFLFNLKYYLDQHAGKERGMVWCRVPAEGTREEIWSRLTKGGLVTAPVTEPDASFTVDIPNAGSGRVVSARPGYHFAGELPDLDDSLLFIELEGKHVGIWLSTYGQPEERVAGLQSRLDEVVERALEVA